MDDNNIYLDVFFEETDTYLGTLNDDVLKLEENPEDLDMLNAIFRSAHTLKGMAATMGYDTMARLTHEMENVFELLKNGEATATHDTVSLIFNCLDTLSEIVEDLRAGGNGEADVAELVNELKTISDSEAEADDGTDSSASTAIVPNIKDYSITDIRDIKENESLGYKGYVIAIQISEETPMKGVRAFLILNDLKGAGELKIVEPSEEEMEAEDYDGVIQVLIVTKQAKADIIEMLMDETDIEAVAVEEALSVLKDPEEENKSKEKKVTENKPRPVTQKRQTIRVDLTRLDQFMNLVSELVIHRSRLENITMEQNVLDVHEPLEQVERITSELQDVVLQLRMQPFSVAVQRFPRMIRDLSGELNKDLKLVINGEDTELDRTVVSELSEPLVHLLRNAADHGIEEPDDREAAGKPRQGVITVGAYAEGNRVAVTISDDGKGIDPQIIGKSAEGKGIDTTGLSDQEIIQLIFHAGFSTKSEVTGVSGRGVGMDVVKEKINSLNGTISLESVVGKGSTFRITLPLTLSIIQALLVNAGDDTFAIPHSVIEKVEEFSEKSINYVHQAEVYEYNGSYIPVVYLSETLGHEKELAEEPYVIIINDRNRFFALVVDGLQQQREIVIKDLGKELSNMKEYLGATILGNGEVILILDVSTILTAERGMVYENS